MPARCCTSALVVGDRNRRPAEVCDGKDNDGDTEVDESCTANCSSGWCYVPHGTFIMGSPASETRQGYGECTTTKPSTR